MVGLLCQLFGRARFMSTMNRLGSIYYEKAYTNERTSNNVNTKKPLYNLFVFIFKMLILVYLISIALEAIRILNHSFIKHIYHINFQVYA